MFSKRERRKSKCISGGTKVCKAKEVRKYFVNSKIESFWHVCKLHYVQFGFQIYISSRLQMFFGTGALKNFAMFAVKYLCWSFFLIMLQAFMSAISLKETQTQVFFCEICEIFFTEHFRWLLLEISYELSLSLSVAYENDEWCHWMYVLALQLLFHFIACVSFLSTSFFFLNFTTCLGIVVSLSILKKSGGVVPRF